MGRFFQAVAGLIASIFRGDDIPEVAPFPPLDLNITFVSNPTPQSGETVTIRWDYGNSNRLVSQTWQLHSLTFDGRRVTETHGCLPASLLAAGQQPDPCLMTSDREATFVFKGPVIFDLIAQSDDDKIYEQMVRLALPDMSFTVNANVEFAGYPRFAPQGVDLAFERAFGIFEQGDHDGHEDGIIDHLARDPYLSAAFPAARPFYLTSNRPDFAEAAARFENVGFDPLLGRRFPHLKTTFLATNDGAEFRNGPRTEANMTIVGLTFAIDGVTKGVPTAATNKATVIEPAVRSLEPIFVQIDLRSSDQGKPIVVSDIHIGNITQGLVFSVHHDVNDSIQATGLTTGADDIDPIVATSSDPVRRSSGAITGARCGMRIVRIGQPHATPAHATLSASWSNVPLFPNRDLSGLFSTQFPAP